MKQKGNEWTDYTGRVVPKYAVNPVLKLEEKFAHQVADKANLATKHLQDLVNLCIKAHTELYDAKCKDAEIKGNKTPSDGMTFNSFDGSVSIKLTKPDCLYFDSTYTNLVQEKFDEYFNEAFQGSDERSLFLRQLVSDLLKTSGGKLDQNKVLQLRKYRAQMSKIAEKTPNSHVTLFIQAVDLMDKAIRTKPGNMGIYVSIRDIETGKMVKIPLKYTDI